MKFKPLRSVGLFGVFSLSVIALVCLILLNTVRFDDSFRAAFDRKHGLYDQSMASRSQTYLVEALALIPALNRREGVLENTQQKILEKLDFAYAYFNVGSYLDHYDCTSKSLDAILRIREAVEQSKTENFQYNSWHQVLSCYGTVQRDQETLKTNMIERAVDASIENQYWMNIGIAIVYSLGVMLWLTLEYQHRQSSKQVEEKLAWQSRALTDHLTSTFNRLALQKRLEQLVQSWPQSPASAALLFYDLDHFKAYNDTFGHVAGDKALQRVTKAVSGVLGGYENHFRFGGEEFFIISEAQHQSALTALGNDIVEAVRKLKIKNPDSESGYLTVSVGVYQLDRRKYTSDELMKTVDELLYVAKQHGRDRVVDEYS